MPEHPCNTCTAWVKRPRIEPFCERGTWYGHIGCLKRSTPAPVQTHTGELPPKLAAKKRGRRP